MPFMGFLKSFLFAAIVALPANLAFAAPQPSAPAPAILPQQFAGWQMQGSTQASRDPATADPTNAALLKEYGFTDVESAAYKRDDGQTLKIRAARFSERHRGFRRIQFLPATGHGVR